MQIQENALTNPLGIGDKLADLVSGREYYEVEDIWVDEDLVTNVKLTRYWNNTDSMVQKNTISVTVEDIAERLQENEIAFM